MFLIDFLVVVVAFLGSILFIVVSNISSLWSEGPTYDVYNIIESSAFGGNYYIKCVYHVMGWNFYVLC